MAKKSSDDSQHFGWVLNDDGQPVPVGLVEDTKSRYTCPICGSRMTPRFTGNRPYFHHQSPEPCTREAVAVSAGWRWLKSAFEARLAAGTPCLVQWRMEGKEFFADLLHGVASVVGRDENEDQQLDVVLLDANGRKRCVILAVPPDEALQNKLALEDAPILVVPTEEWLAGAVTLNSILKFAKFIGAWWLQDPSERPPTLEISTQQYWDVILNAVADAPYRWCGELGTLGDVQHVLTINGHSLWMPGEIWDLVFRGRREQLYRRVFVTRNQWQLKDGTYLQGFYVVVYQEGDAISKERGRAVGFKRFMLKDNQKVASIQMPRLINPQGSAREIACAFIMSVTGTLGG